MEEPAKTEIEKPSSFVSFAEFKKIKFRVGKILSAEKVEGANNLLRLEVEVGEARPRQLVAGIAKNYPDFPSLVGRQVVVVANLEPAKIRGMLSEGMLLAAYTQDFSTVSVLIPDTDVPVGCEVG